MSIFDFLTKTPPTPAPYEKSAAQAAAQLRQGGDFLLQAEPGTAYAIARMIDLTQKILPFESEKQFAAYSDAILYCCAAAARAETIEELNAEFTQEKLALRVSTWLPFYSNKLDAALLRNRPWGDDGSYMRQARRNMLSQIGTMANAAAELKVLYAVSSNMAEKSEAGYLQAYRTSDASYMNEFFAIIDALATGIAAAQLLFAEKAARNVSETSEFYRLIENLSEKSDDLDTVKDKSYDLYSYFYKKELGNITDEMLYACAVHLLLRRMEAKKGGVSDFDTAVQFQPVSVDNYDRMQERLERWVGKTAKDYPDQQSSINGWIAGRIVKSAAEPHVMLQALRDLHEYRRIYDETVKFNKAIELKARYLRGEVD